MYNLKYLSITVLKNWQVFMAVCALPTILSAILSCFFPESPKFLMSQGKNKEALQVFQTVYKINTGKSKLDYPVRIN